MEQHPIIRLLTALFTGVLMLGMILGNMQLAKIDPDLIWVRPTRVSLAPTATYYPTTVPDTPVPTGTPISTPTPRSILVDVCEQPAGWLPYVVKAGDTLSKLALGTGLPAHVLLRENCLGSPELQAGEVIYLPPLSVVSPTAPAYTCGPPLGWQPVIVQPDDTLYSLAVRYGTTIQAIRRANCLTGYTIYVGSPLYLPPRMVITPTWTPTPPPTFTPTATASNTPTAVPTTPTATVTATITSVPTLTQTATPTPTSPVSPTLTQTPTPSTTPTVSETTTPTATVPTFTPTPTATPTPTSEEDSPTPTATATEADPTPTFTPSATVTLTPTATSSGENP